MSALPCIYVIKLYPTLNYFALHVMVSFKQAISTTEVFHFQIPRLGFLFLPPVSFEII